MILHTFSITGSVASLFLIVSDIEEQKVVEVKLIEVEGVKEWKVEKVLNKRKVREVVKYLVQWKGLIIEHDS